MMKLDITSSAAEKGLEIARDFLDKLITPAAEEVGLLMRDSVSLWKLKNQVRVLTKARDYCKANGISPNAVPLKILCPLLENAALEEDESIQDKWAILLANLTDSEQNVRNHVFPYILSQVSADEFAFLERVYAEKKVRVACLNSELTQLRNNRPTVERELRDRIAELESQLETIVKKNGHRFSQDRWDLSKRKS